MTQIQKLLIATHNPAKKQELRDGFSPLFERGVELLSLDDLHITADPEETGKTFFENAQLKAKYFAELSHLPTVADDGGIEIDALNGEPGVHSKRWLGRQASDDEMIEYTLKKLINTSTKDRTAKFTVCLYYCNPTNNFSAFIQQSLKGVIAKTASPQARKGFPYRALFEVVEYKTMYDELTEERHKQVNHRLKAIQKLIPFIKKDLLQ